MSRSELQEGGWLFYIVVVELADGGTVGFLRRYNPQRGFGPGRLFTHFQGSLKRFTNPVFNFDLGFDLIVAPDELAVLSLGAFESVFSDVEVAIANVPTEVATLNDSLGIGLDAPSRAVLGKICREKPSLAKRLRRTAALGHLETVKKRALREALARHGFDRDLFGRGNQLAIDGVEEVRVLFDVLEELYFEADFTGEHRRADRFSPL